MRIKRIPIIIFTGRTHSISFLLLFSKLTKDHVPHASEGKEDGDPPLYVQAVRLAEGDGLGRPEHQGNWSGWCGVPVGPFLDKAAESIA